MDTFCTDNTNDDALLFVSGGYNIFIDLATRTYDLAIEQTQAINAFTIAPIAFNVNFDFEGELAAFQRPLKPVFDLSRLDFNDPGNVPEPADFIPGDVVVATAPTFDEVAPTISYGAKPDLPDIVAPIAPPRPVAAIIPLPPDYVLPELPTFESLNLPTLPTVVIPEFDGQKPVFDVVDINETWNYNYEAYASTLLTDIKGKISQWLQGGTGLPAAIEQALFDRATARVDDDVSRSIEAAYEQHSARGFTQPNGILNAQIIEIRRNGQNKASEINRDLTIRFHEEELVNIRLAVSQGAALEGVLMNLHIEEQKLFLAENQFLRDSAIAILNSKIAIFNSKNQAYATDAQVLESRIRGALAAVEVYRAQIEGEKLKGELNTQKVQIYSEQIRAIALLADFYKTRIEAVKIEGENNKLVIESYTAEVEAYGKRWDAYTSEWNGYRAGVDAEGSKANVFKTLADVFGTRMNAYNIEQNANIEKERIHIAQHDQELRAWRGKLDVLLAYVQKEQVRIGSVAQTVDAQARIYQADAAIESAASAATDRTFELGLARENARTQTELRNAEIAIQQNIQITQLQLEVKRVVSNVLSQLASSTMSAMSFSAGLSSSKSDGRSCSTAVSWSGEAPDLE